MTLRLTPRGAAAAVDVLEGRTLLSSPAGAASTLPSYPNGFFAAGDGAYFFAATASSAGTTTLWKTDGTPGGTTPLRGGFLFEPKGYDNPSPLAYVGGTFYFSAYDHEHGQELWASDGTSSGTRLVKDIAPGFLGEMPRSSAPNANRVAGLGGKLYFVAHDDSAHSSLWVTDGTAEGTQPFFDPHPDIAFAGVMPPLASGGMIYFMAFGAGTVAGPGELWRTDGTARGTIKLHEFRTDPQDNDSFADVWHSLGDDSVLLSAPASHDSPGRELWRSDGTPEGTVLVADILPGPKSSQMSFLTLAGDSLYFSATRSSDPETGWPIYGLWKTDGTAAGTVPVLEQVSGSRFGLLPVQLADFDGGLILTGYDPEHGRELWRSDGTAAGTTLVTDIAPGPYNGCWPIGFSARAGNFLTFYADDRVHGVELWRTDGTEAGTSLLRDINPGPGDSTPLPGLGSGVTLPNGDLLFDAMDEGGDVEPWITDGTEAGTRRLADLNTSRAVVVGRQLFYNNSFFDGYNPAANAADDAALPHRIFAQVPSMRGGWADVSSYDKGINGVMIDVRGLAADVELDAGDFNFQVGSGGDPSGWGAGPAPSSITTRRGAGLDGSDRVTLVWPDNAIKNAILRVTVVPSDRTGLAADVFAFGNLVGSVAARMSRASVGVPDVLLTSRAASRGRADVDSLFDHDRNGRVDLRDALLARRNGGHSVYLRALPGLPDPNAVRTKESAVQADVNLNARLWFGDVNRDGQVNALDCGQAKAQLGRRLPTSDSTATGMLRGS